ncbi:MAG: hypothetical protein HY862_11125 [Chloroflexi bacterium]|nr:hypothetical protein [Chloroflexota bacterium]
MIIIPNKLAPFVMPIVLIVLWFVGAQLQVNEWNDHEQYQQLLNNGSTTTAVVTDSHYGCIGQVCDLYYVSYDYAVNGRTYHTNDEHIFHHKLDDPVYDPSQQISILYLADDPSFSYIASNLGFPREKATDYGMVPIAVLWGFLISLLWKPHREYAVRSCLDNGFFHLRYNITYIAILVFIQVAAIAHEKGEAFKGHAIWFFPLMLVFGIPWVEIFRSDKSSESQASSIQGIALDIAFPVSLGIFATFLTFSSGLRNHQLILTIYLALSCLIALTMMKVWRVYKPLGDDFQKFIKRG